MITDKFELKQSRRCCPFDKSKAPIFFSLIDYRNNYFTSNDPKKILEFYNGFDNRDQLIQWMREKPKGLATIHEVEGDKDIIVVIPTGDFNGKYAKECRDNIFKGLHMVFVESAEIPDPYFNGAHNVNVGIKEAMKYNPKWVVFSGDDMVKRDPAKVLREQLLSLNNEKFDVIFTEPSIYHSSLERISQPNFLYFLYYMITNKNYGRAAINLYKKFEIRYLMSPVSGKFSKLFKKGYLYLEIQDFGIYSSIWISKMGDKIYDDTFINAAEDTDLSLIIALGGIRTAKIKYRIGDLIGSSLGTGIQRSLRSIAGLTYLNYKWRDHIMDPVTYRQHEHGETIK